MIWITWFDHHICSTLFSNLHHNLFLTNVFFNNILQFNYGYSPNRISHSRSDFILYYLSLIVHILSAVDIVEVKVLHYLCFLNIIHIVKNRYWSLDIVKYHIFFEHIESVNITSILMHILFELFLEFYTRLMDLVDFRHCFIAILV